MHDLAFKGGVQGANSGAIAAFDTALWDLKAKLKGEPLRRTLGASEGRVKAYASGLDMPLTDEKSADFYTWFTEMGIYGSKLKVGLDIDTDIRRLGIVKDCLRPISPRPLRCIDSNEYWLPKQAVGHVSELERHSIPPGWRSRLDGGTTKA